MKGYAVRLIIIMLAGCGLIGINACRKTNTTPPTVVILGPSTIHISLNGTYTDQGATANDVQDGTDAVLSDYSLSNPNVDLVGTYIIHYSAYDSDGNTGTAIRTVIVSNDAQNTAGIDSVTDNITGKNAGLYAYNITVSVSPTVNNQVFISNFSGLGGDVTVAAKVSGNAIFLSPGTQSPSGMKDPGVISNLNGTIPTSLGNRTAFTYVIAYNSSGTDHGSSSVLKIKN